MAKVDTVTLTKVINECFDFAMDGRLTDARQDKFRAHGKRLRGALVNLLTVQFEEGTPLLLDANQKLAEVNSELAEDVEVLADVAAALNNIAKLVSILDKLLNVAVAFV